MTRSSLHQAAIEYGRNWFRAERGFVDGLASSDRRLRLAALRRAAGYFIIGRNFPKRFDVDRGLDRLAPALAQLEHMRIQPIRAADLAAVVLSFARQLGAEYGGKILLSAATKLLWLVHRDVAVIYDSRARTALQTRFGDYPQYLDSWRHEYAVNRDLIRSACTALTVPALSSASAYDVSDAELQQLAGREWFQRRVFDIYLWNLGEPTSPHRSTMGKDQPPALAPNLGH